MPQAPDESGLPHTVERLLQVNSWQSHLLQVNSWQSHLHKTEQRSRCEHPTRLRQPGVGHSHRVECEVCDAENSKAQIQLTDNNYEEHQQAAACRVLRLR